MQILGWAPGWALSDVYKCVSHYRPHPPDVVLLSGTQRPVPAPRQVQHRRTGPELCRGRGLLVPRGHMQNKLAPLIA